MIDSDRRNRKQQSKRTASQRNGRITKIGSVRHPFIMATRGELFVVPTFNKYLLRFYCVPGTVLRAEDIPVKKTGTNLCLHRVYILVDVH